MRADLSPANPASGHQKSGLSTSLSPGKSQIYPQQICMLRCFFLARNATCCEVQFIAGDRKKPGERKGPLKLARDRTLHSNVLNRKGFWVAKRMKQFFGAVECGSQLKGSSGSPKVFGPEGDRGGSSEPKQLG